MSIERRNDLTESDKGRVNLAIPAARQDLCSIELRPQAVEFTQIVIRKFGKRATKELDSLEYWWGLRHRSLNLKSRYNIIPIGASLRRMFDLNYWMLLPDTEVIKQFHEGLSMRPWYGIYPAREKFPQIDAGAQFNYTFLPLTPDMAQISVVIDTKAGQRSPDEQYAPEDFSIHTYPFAQVQVRSHLHPKFAIYEAGRKLRLKGNSYLRLTGVLPQYKEVLYMIEDIYYAWCQDVPAEGWDREDFRALEKDERPQLENGESARLTGYGRNDGT